MATILIVDDRPINRQFLQTLLGYGGHRIIDAVDGAEALNSVRTERPDLVITDILMPRMDGFEFTQQLRAEPDLAGTKVIFYTATYSVPDADKLAKACGVSVVLPKPSEPSVILNAVNEALALQPAPEQSAVVLPKIPPDLNETAALDRIGAHISAHLSYLQSTQPIQTGARSRSVHEQPNEATAKFVTHVAQLESLTARLCALLELRSALITQRDPFKMQETFCRGARSIVNAEYMMLVVMDDTGQEPSYCVSTGVGSTAVIRHDQVTVQAVKTIKHLAGQGPLRLSGAAAQTQAGDLPESGSDTKCLLSVPVINESMCYGLLWFINREGSSVFSNEDEEFAVMLAAELALLQENLDLYLLVQQHAANMQLEIINRKEAEQAIRRINRVHAVLSGINNLIIRAQNGPQLFSDACRIAVEQGRFGMSWIGTFDAAQQEITPVAWSGIDDMNFSVYAKSPTREDLPTGQSLVARAVRSRVPVFENDIAANPWAGSVHRRDAIRLGYRSAIALPLLVDDEVVGTMVLHAKEAGFFNADEVKLLTELSDDISFALKSIRLQQELVAEQHLLHNLMDNVPDAIYFKDRAHRFVRLNRVQAQRLNLSRPENGIGKTIGDFVSQDQATRIEAEDNKIFSSGQAVVDRIVPIRLADGRDAWTSTTKAPIRDRAGRISGLVGISRDITERKQAEIALRQLKDELEVKIATRTEDLNKARQEAEKANHAKSGFLAAMSHEIRTPMNGVIGMIDVLHQSSLRGDQVEMVDLIRESAYSLLGIINDILDVSKIEAGKLELEKVPMAVQDVVEGVGGMLDRLAQNSDVELTMFIDPAIPPEVAGDALRLRQILINLANNAIKFSAKHARRGRVSMRAILVRSDPELVSVEFQVTDNGIGMNEQTLERLFKAFSQADASTTRRFGGTGLGLVITNHLLELMGGEITVQSAPGEGSTFKARVPFTLLPGGTMAAEKYPKIDGLSLVVVGTGGGLSDDLAAYLTHGRAQVERAPDLESAMEARASKGELTVWVVDTHNENRSPEQLHAIVSAARPDVRIVAVTPESAQQPRQQMGVPGLITIGGNALKRQTFLRAVAAAAGRASMETEAERSRAFKSASIAPSREDAQRQGKLILVAEDNETNQKVILRQLALLGYAADIAADGREALDRWRNGDYALVLTDLQMPNMDGYDLTKAIRGEEKDGKRIPIIALTANALKDEADACRAVGMNDYLSKPSPLANLRASLEKWLPIATNAAAASTTPASRSHDQ